MEELIKKGSMVTKRFGILDIPKKYRHRVVFGCDCLYVDGRFYPLKEDTPLLVIKPLSSKVVFHIKKLEIYTLFAV